MVSLCGGPFCLVPIASLSSLCEGDCIGSESRVASYWAPLCWFCWAEVRGAAASAWSINHYISCLQNVGPFNVCTDVSMFTQQRWSTVQRLIGSTVNFIVSGSSCWLQRRPFLCLSKLTLGATSTFLDRELDRGKGILDDRVHLSPPYGCVSVSLLRRSGGYLSGLPLTAGLGLVFERPED